MKIQTAGVGVALVAAMVGAGCSSATGPSTRPTSGPAASSSSGVLASASASGSPDAGPPPNANVSALGFALRSQQNLELFQVDDAVYAIAQQFYQPQVYRVDDSSVAEQPDLFKTLKVTIEPSTPNERHFRVVSMSGTTSELDIAYNEPGERGGTTRDAHLRKAAWKSDADYPYNGDCWGGRCTPLATGVNLIVGEENVFELIAPAFMMPKPKGWVPVATKAGAAPGCATRMGTYHWIGVVGDRVIGIGKECTGKDAEANAFSIEMWKKGSATSTFTELPGKRTFSVPINIEVRETPGGFLIAASGDESFPAPFIARFDGKAWTDLSPGGGTGLLQYLEFGPKRQAYAMLGDVGFRRDGEQWTKITFPARVDGQSIAERYEYAPDGALWAVIDGRLYRVATDGTRMEPVVLPSSGDAATGGELTAVDVRFTPNGDAVVSAEDANAHYLLLPTKRAPAKPIVAPEPKNKVAFGDVTPANASCTKPFVVLYGMTKVAPDDYDFPLTRKALKGKLQYKDTRFWVTRDAGQRFLIARVATVQLGRDLVKDISASVKDSKPQLLCGDPAETIRELKIDLATGDVVK
ncbi:MAG: hypothetical protein U0414_35090 [Polyangiaceae bacterium]